MLFTGAMPSRMQADGKTDRASQPLQWLPENQPSPTLPPIYLRVYQVIERYSVFDVQAFSIQPVQPVGMQEYCTVETKTLHRSNKVLYLATAMAITPTRYKSHL